MNRTIQTAFRFKPEMVRRMKNRARIQGQSLNAYIEALVQKDLGEEEDRQEALYKALEKIELPKTVSPEIEECFSKYKIQISAEELAADEKLAYLLSK